MHDTPTQTSDRLDQIIAEYLAAEEAGETPSPEDVIAANPDLANELRRFFANREELAGALPGEPPRKRFVPPTVRYFGDYELLDEIARGGMGVVYRAKQTSLNRIVAIKMILSGHLARDEDVKRFHTEAEAAGKLKHPGIVPVHEVGVHEGHHYYSMDYIEGRSLAEIVRENPLPARKAAEYVRSIAEAVHYAHNHQQGTLHRDLKPSNILIDGEDHVHVTDFGLAVRVDGDSELTRTGDVLGTPAYMPPEQAQAKRGLIGPASDVYALGAILYELLTGRPPFRGESPVETLKLVVEAEPVSPRLLNPKVPRDLETICLKCLQKEPHKRFLTADELADDLGRWLRGEAITARPIGPVGRAWRWARRNPAPAALASSILLLIAAAISFGFWFQQVRADRALAELSRVADFERAVEMSLNEARTLGERAQSMRAEPAQWEAMLAAALLAIDRAEALLDREPGLASPSLRASVREQRILLDSEERDRRLVTRLEEIKLLRIEPNVEKGEFQDKAVAEEYENVFRAYGLSSSQMEATAAAELVANRPAIVREHLLGAFDEWGRWTVGSERQWYQYVVAAADPDPWRNQVRDAARRRDRETLESLAAELNVREQPPQMIWLLNHFLLHVGSNALALTVLRRGQECFPDDVRLNMSLGTALAAQQPPSPEAIRFLTAAVALRPENAGGWLNLGVTLDRAGDDSGAMAAFRRAIELSPRHFGAYNNLGNSLKSSGDIVGAIEAFQKAVEIEPHFAMAHYNLGSAFREMGDAASAIAACEQAISIDENYGEPHIIIGLVLTESGNFRAAIRAFQAAIEADPESAIAHISLGNALRANGDLSGSISAFEKAVEVDGSSAAAHASLCNALKENGDIPGAIAAGERAISIDSQMAGAHYNLGNAYLEQQNYRAAIAAFQTAIELRADHAEAHSNLGAALEGVGDLAWAIAEFKKASNLDPELAPPVFGLGRTLRRAGHLSESAAAYRRLIEMRPKAANIYYRLGGVLAELGDFGSAAAAYSTAVELSPDYAEAHCKLGHTLMQQGDFAGALAAAQRGQELGSQRAHWTFPSAELIRQCERYIEVDSRLDAVLSEESEPSDTAELIDFAHVCGYRRRFAESVRLYEEAFNHNPELLHHHTLCAARTAIQAASDRDNPSHDAESRRRYRQTALRWLREMLAQMRPAANSASPDDRSQMRRSILRCRNSLDLALIRDEAALADLPDDEQQACRQFWSDVDALIQTLSASSAP